MDDLDKLAAEFADRGYVIDGVEHHHENPTHGHGEGARRFTHRGHEVEIVTHYRVTIDGEPWEQHVEVLDDGSVTYHGLPQYAIPSAVDLIRRLIDYEEDMPDDLREAFRAAREEE